MQKHPEDNVTLSEAKGLAHREERFLALLGMTAEQLPWFQYNVG